METSIGGDQRQFLTTSWTLVLNARQPDQLNRLISLYWKPVYWTLRLRWNRSPEDAKDLTQEFFTVFLEKDYVAQADRERGKFRTFVRAALDNFMKNAVRDAGRLKRGGGAAAVRIHLDEQPLELAASSPSPDRVFDRAWAESLMNDVVREVRDEYVRSGRERYAQVFERHDLCDGDSPTYEETARALSIGVDDVHNYLKHARKALREKLRRRILDTLSDPDQVDAELRDIFGEP